MSQEARKVIRAINRGELPPLRSVNDTESGCARICPRCKSKRVFVGTKHDVTKFFFPDRWIVICLDCNNRTREKHTTKEGAIKEWNRRTTGGRS